MSDYYSKYRYAEDDHKFNLRRWRDEFNQIDAKIGTENTGNLIKNCTLNKNNNIERHPSYRAEAPFFDVSSNTKHHTSGI